MQSEEAKRIMDALRAAIQLEVDGKEFYQQSGFTQATKEQGSKVKIAQAELEAIKIARDMENKSYDFYQARYAEAVYPKEQKYYQSLAAEERGHYLALVDSYEYLTDPAGWFAGKEHVSLDGG